MQADSVTISPPAVADDVMPRAAALSWRGTDAVSISPDGEVVSLTRRDARQLLTEEPVLVCHAAFLGQRLGSRQALRRRDLFDVMELVAFVRPATPCIPTPTGLALALGLDSPQSAEDDAMTIAMAAHGLLSDLGHPDFPGREQAVEAAATMTSAGWAWGPSVLRALGSAPKGGAASGAGLDVWRFMPEWEERAPQGGKSSDPVSAEEAGARLRQLLGEETLPRPGQVDYASAAAEAFAPRGEDKAPAVVVAEAGTGTGKTLGYIAPASVWAEKNGPGVWISTYTKNLQRQMDQELSKLYPLPDEKRRRTAIRKGRENYLCLLSYQDTVQRVMLGGGGPDEVIYLGLVSRWALASRDGDMVGGDFPGWLTPPAQSLAAGSATLTDRRGECIYSACPHYRKCPIERAVRRARHAHIVVANHAVVMHHAATDHVLRIAMGSDDPGTERRLRVVFDEGHHIFDAADGAFGTDLSATETSDLRRWIRGADNRRVSRSRGLTERISDLTGDDEEATTALQEVVRAAAALPVEGWSTRITDRQERAGAEAFFGAVFRQVEARNPRQASPHYGLETEVHPLEDSVLAAAAAFEKDLVRIKDPMIRLAKRLRDRLDDEADTLETATRTRLDAAAKGLERRAFLTVPAWTAMIASLQAPQPDTFVDWFALERLGGRMVDVGMHRRYIDPTQPFAKAVLEEVHGALITSATLRDLDTPVEGDAPRGDDWSFAGTRTGTSHLPAPAIHVGLTSPFDYKAQTRIVVVNDLDRNAPDQVASAFRELFRAAGGGGLGLFTAISRLRACHERIAAPLEADGIPLYAQHVDAVETGTLIDIFRTETNACLLGTDALREGVDVPGRSLRLIVFDRVPWPRPDIIHRARRKHLGGKDYDDRLTRLRLKQAYGRLIRGPEDKGVFVMVDNRMPSRLCSAFPPGVEVQRIGLAEAVSVVKSFL